MFRKNGISQDAVSRRGADVTRDAANPSVRKSTRLPVVLARIAAVIVVSCLFAGCSGGNSGGNTDTTCSHQWRAATCTEASVCNLCGKTGDKAQGHTWKAATCAEAAVCTVCGKTEGSTLSHTWKAATCTEAAVCTMCGKTEGAALGHNWEDATFTTAKTCQICSATDGQPISYSHITVQHEVDSIAKMYNDIEWNRTEKLYKMKELSNGAQAYYDRNDNLACVIVFRGTKGIGSYSDTYSRCYYFDNGKLFFAFFEGNDSHRLYFYDEMLMRWRYTSTTGTAVNYDFDFSKDYFQWEELALNEVQTFY